MKAYSMKIIDHRDTRKIPVEFRLIRYFNIQNEADFDKICERLSINTKRDGYGRVLCVGKVGYSQTDQTRLFTVKRSYSDKSLWKAKNILSYDYWKRKEKVKNG